MLETMPLSESFSSFKKAINCSSSTKWSILIVVQILISLYAGTLFTLSYGREDRQTQFKVTSKQEGIYASVKSLREKLIVEKPVKDEVWQASIPLTYINEINISVYGVNAIAKYMGPYQKEDKYARDGYNGPLTLTFHDFSQDFALYFRKDGPHSKVVVDIKNFVEVGQEFYTCATLKVYTVDAIYNIKITDGCMFIKALLQNWAIRTRSFLTFDYVDNHFPEEFPPEANGADRFVISFVREQPCQFAMEYIMKNGRIVYSIPLKTVSYEPSPAKNVETNGNYVDIIGEAVDGKVYKFTTQNSYMVEQSVKHYHETDKLYPLKIVPYLRDDNDGSVLKRISHKSFDDHNQMWLTGASFKYDVTNKSCHIVSANSDTLLHKNNVQFVVHDTIVKIVTGKMVGICDHYGALIAAHAEKCGIYNVISNEVTN